MQLAANGQCSSLINCVSISRDPLCCVKHVPFVCFVLLVTAALRSAVASRTTWKGRCRDRIGTPSEHRKSAMLPLKQLNKLIKRVQLFYRKIAAYMAA